MTRAVLTDKKEIVSSFSPERMGEILAASSKAEARKYFITEYFVPLILTAWYQGEELNAKFKSDACSMRLIPTTAGLEPHITFEPTANVVGVTVVTALAQNILAQVEKMVFEKRLTAEWNKALPKVVEAAFEDCFPSVRGAANTLQDCPVVAAMHKSDTAAGTDIKLTVLIKTRDKIRNNQALYNQGDKLNAKLMIQTSTKYRKMYNVITGEWKGVCDPSDPEICEACKTIYASPAARNAYDDPDFK